MAKDYSDDIARLSTATRTHWSHFTVPELPWHTDDHKFGEASEPVRTDDPGDASDGGPQPQDSKDE